MGVFVNFVCVASMDHHIDPDDEDSGGSKPMDISDDELDNGDDDFDNVFSLTDMIGGRAIMKAHNIDSIENSDNKPQQIMGQSLLDKWLQQSCPKYTK